MMQPYIAYTFTVHPNEPWSEILLAALSELPFESFEFTPIGLNAYIPKKLWTKNILASITLFQNSEVNISYTLETIASANWNAEWETGFSPIEIDDRCVVRAHFHPKTDAPFELVITPRMSFGTGHHETTQMMLKYVLDLSVEDSSILDMGCGTGILAILAAKRGAQIIHGIDNDSNCVANSKENAVQNNQEDIAFWTDENPPEQEDCYDFIFANINKNVLLNQMPNYLFCLKPGGHLILSGFFVADVPELVEQATVLGLRKRSEKAIEKWAALHFTF